jgi:RNA polymerase sigma-70 factor (ECF subfamily)
MDERDFKKIYDAYAKQLYNFILWMSVDRSQSDDILQSVFVKVWRSGGVPGQENERRAWLFAVARNTCIDFFRERARRAECGESGLPCSAEPDGIDPTGTWREVAKLPFAERAAIYFHIRMGYSYAEIGAMTGMTETNARVTAFRALRKLRNLLVRKEP